MSDDILDEFGFPLSLSEQFWGRTMRVTNIQPQSSATQDEDWYEEQVSQPISDRDREAERLRPFVKPGQELVYNEELRSWRIEEKIVPVDTTTACIGRLPGEAFWAWAQRMGEQE